jgi:hypothetical protein
MGTEQVIETLGALRVEDGALQIDAKGEDALQSLLSSPSIPLEILQAFACDCVERFWRKEQESGHALPRQVWEILMVKRLWLVGEASDMMLLDARVNAQVVSWNHERRRFKPMEAMEQMMSEKTSTLAQLLPETERHWQCRAIREATEALAWRASSAGAGSAPHEQALFWLGASEHVMFAGWIDAWNRERAWQKEHLLSLLTGHDAAAFSAPPLLEAV